MPDRSAIHAIGSLAKQVRRVAAEIPDTEFYGILDDLGIPRLDEITNFGLLAKLVERMNNAQSKRPAA